MTAASTKYDKMHPAAPCLDGFTGGPIKVQFHCPFHSSFVLCIRKYNIDINML